MEKRYKVIVSNKNFYKEFELTSDKKQISVGTNAGCSYRLHRDFFFEQIQLDFINMNNSWKVFCSDNLKLTRGGSDSLIAAQLKHGDFFIVKYLKNNSNAFTIEFLVDFDISERRYERAIDISKSAELRIGTDKSCEICIESPYVENDLIYIRRNIEGYEYIVKNSTYGVYINGCKAAQRGVIKSGDFFFVSDFIFYYKNGVLWSQIRDDLVVNRLNYSDNPIPKSYPKFIRNARIKRVINKDNIEVLDPPAKPTKSRNNILTSMISSIGMIGIAVAMAMQGGTMMWMSIMTAALSFSTMIASIVQNKISYKKSVKQRLLIYNEYANNKRKEIEELRNQECSMLKKIYIDENQEMNLFRTFSNDLFDRRKDDEDFLHVRLGTGKVKANREVKYKKQECLETDELSKIPQEISSAYELINDAPVVCNFKDGNAIGIIGAEDDRFSLMKNIVIDICARQYYSDVELVFIARPEHLNKIKWLRMSPFVSNNSIKTRNIACDDESKNMIFDLLYKELSQRSTQGKESNNDNVSNYKHIVAFFYDDYGFQTHPVSKFSDRLKDLEATFVFMADDKAQIPQCCKSLIFVEPQKSGCLVNVENESDNTRFNFKPIADDAAQKIMDFLSPVYTQEVSLEGSLTKNISLFEMLNIMVVDDLDLEQRWEDSQVYKSMAAPIGVTRSATVYLDLHDKAHGPHGLVAGTTGSGKSEVLQTYILSIATIFHPYEVSFLIIDFKGGGMVNQFKDLPHLRGAITNIDGKAINRSLKSIEAERNKREALFAQAGVNHIDAYIKKYKAGEVSEPIPHLILIVDEFAELRASQPEFMNDLISIARVGRSLGIHLILATQKPSGQVDEQISSNTNFSICLKVKDAADSNEVIQSPLAAEITEPGRAYLKVGNNEVFELFQSAYSGAPEKMTDSNIKQYSICEVNNSGIRTPVFVQKKPKISESNINQLQSIVSYVDNYCKQRHIKRLDNICMPELERNLDFIEKDFVRNYCFNIGIYDDPDNQAQPPVFLDLDNKNTIVFGSAQTGKTNFLKSIIRSIATEYTPDEANIYILDFASESLKAFEALNHVGGVLLSNEDEKLNNFFKLLFEEIAARKAHFFESGVSSFAAYREAGYKDIPHIYIIIDNFVALTETYFMDDDRLLNLLRDGIAAGISVISACTQPMAVGSRYLSNFANKISYHLNDSSEYSYVFENNKLVPDDIAGRCIVKIDRTTYECQNYISFDGKTEKERNDKAFEFIKQANARSGGRCAKKIPCIPSVLTQEIIAKDFNAQCNGFNVPIGLSYKEVEPFYMDLSQLKIMGLCGKSEKGHRNFIKYILDTLEANKEQSPAKVVIFDDIKRRFSEFADYCVVDKYSLNTQDVNSVIEQWHCILKARYDAFAMGEFNQNNELLLMVVENNDVAKVIEDDYSLSDKFEEMMGMLSDMNIAIIFSNYQNTNYSYDSPKPLKMIKDNQHIIFFDEIDTLKPFDVPYEAIRENRKKLSKGDAYYINDNMVAKLKLIKA